MITIGKTAESQALLPIPEGTEPPSSTLAPPLRAFADFIAEEEVVPVDSNNGETEEIAETTEKAAENAAFCGFWQVLWADPPKAEIPEEPASELAIETGVLPETVDFEGGFPPKGEQEKTAAIPPVPPAKMEIPPWRVMEPTPRELNVETRQNRHGTPDAKQPPSMSVAQEQDKIAEPPRSAPIPVSMPIEKIDRAPEVVVEPTMFSTVYREKVDHSSPTEPTALSPQPVTEAASLIKVLHDQVLIIKELRRTELQVTFGGPEQQLHLHVKKAGEVVQVSASCDSGSFDLYKNQWMELQRQLDSQGILLQNLEIKDSPQRDQKGHSAKTHFEDEAQPVFQSSFPRKNSLPIGTELSAANSVRSDLNTWWA